MSTTEEKLDTLSSSIEKGFDGPTDGSTQEQPQTEPERKLSKREFEIAMKRAYAERNQKVKENKAMIEDMNLEVSYWKAQSDLLKYRYEKMDYYLKNLELEPIYLLKIEEQRVKQEKEDFAKASSQKGILS